MVSLNNRNISSINKKAWNDYSNPKKAFQQLNLPEIRSFWFHYKPKINSSHNILYRVIFQYIPDENSIFFAIIPLNIILSMWFTLDGSLDVHRKWDAKSLWKFWLSTKVVMLYQSQISSDLRHCHSFKKLFSALILQIERSIYCIIVRSIDALWMFLHNIVLYLAWKVSKKLIFFNLHQNKNWIKFSLLNHWGS